MRPDEHLQALAPHVDAPWREQFITELTLQGAGGAAVSDALVEVETHCRESGMGAAEAFGPATGYARALDLPDESGWTPGQLVSTWAKILLLVAGVWAVFLGIPPLVSGERAGITVGLLVSAAASAVLMAVVFSLGGRVLRLVVEHPVWSTVGFTAVVSATALVGMPFDDVVLGSVPAGPTLAIGIVAAVVSVVWTLLASRSGTGLDDPLALPPAGAPTRPSTAGSAPGPQTLPRSRRRK